MAGSVWEKIRGIDLLFARLARPPEGGVAEEVVKEDEVLKNMDEKSATWPQRWPTVQNPISTKNPPKNANKNLNRKINMT